MQQPQDKHSALADSRVSFPFVISTLSLHLLGAADRAASPVLAEVLLEAFLAEPVPAVGRATRLPQEFRADRAEQLIRKGLPFEHYGSLWSLKLRAANTT